MSLNIHSLRQMKYLTQVWGKEWQKRFSVILLSILVVTFSQASMATLLNFSGSWTSSGYGGLTPDPFAGSYSFVFDDSVLTGTGNESYELPLSSLSLTPATIGAITYSDTNSAAFIEFIDGVLRRYEVGGSNSGEGTPISIHTDDFLVQLLFDVNGIFDSANVLLSNASEDTLGIATNTSFSCLRCPSQAAVPEPTTLALLSLGLAGLGFTRRRMKA